MVPIVAKTEVVEESSPANQSEKKKKFMHQSATARASACKSSSFSHTTQRATALVLSHSGTKDDKSPKAASASCAAIAISNASNCGQSTSGDNDRS